MTGRRITGVVLTGGASERMGVDKATLVIDGMPMAMRVVEALRGAGCDPVECQGGDADVFAEHAIETYSDRNPGDGPVAAIHEALARHPELDVVVAACDLVDLDGATVGALIAAGSADSDVDVAVASTGGSRHLVCWWRSGSATRVGELAAVGVASFRGVLSQLRTVDVEVAPEAVRNVNSPTDLDGRG
jgi:molybdopterin-guanine dinucleotide biosynthesis protein A